MNHNVSPTWLVQQSLASGFDSPVQRVGRAMTFAVFFNVTSATSLNGTVSIMGRIRDFNAPQTRAAVPFVQIDTATATLTAVGASMFNFGTVGYNEVIVRWTPTAGSGNADVYFYKKEYQ